MASKNSIKTDVINGYYHVYNRGVAKMDIFKDESDYLVFLGYLKEYLSDRPDLDIRMRKVYVQDRVFTVVARMPLNYANKIILLCYCLMPNHIHLIINQKELGLMKKFAHSLFLRYSMYFNKKYSRVGPVFQGRYKAVSIEDENYLLYLSKYIHRNPIELGIGLVDAKSSYADYLGLRSKIWLNTTLILSYFEKIINKKDKQNTNYKNFVETETKSTFDIDPYKLD